MRNAFRPNPAADPRDLTGSPAEVRLARARGQVLVQLYAKDGCHLCDDAREVVDRVAGAADDVVVEEIDIRSDPVLQRRYGEDIPVVVVDGRPHAKWRVDAAALERAIDDARRPRRGRPASRGRA